MKDGCVRSSLIELQSFLLSKVDVDPIHRILMFSSMLYACIVHDVVHSSRSFQDPYGFCPWDPQAERIHCLSVAQNLTSRYQF